jgi:hypothetical protein
MVIALHFMKRHNCHGCSSEIVRSVMIAEEYKHKEQYALTPLKSVNPQCTKPISSTLFTKLGSAEDPIVFFVVISQLLRLLKLCFFVFLKL